MIWLREEWERDRWEGEWEEREERWVHDTYIHIILEGVREHRGWGRRRRRQERRGEKEWGAAFFLPSSFLLLLLPLPATLLSQASFSFTSHAVVFHVTVCFFKFFPVPSSSSVLFLLLSSPLLLSPSLHPPCPFLLHQTWPPPDLPNLYIILLHIYVKYIGL